MWPNVFWRKPTAKPADAPPQIAGTTSSRPVAAFAAASPIEKAAATPAKIKAWPPTCFHIVLNDGSASCRISIPSSLFVGGAVQAETTEPYMPPTPAPTIVFMIKPGLSAPMVESLVESLVLSLVLS